MLCIRRADGNILVDENQKSDSWETKDTVTQKWVNEYC